MGDNSSFLYVVRSGNGLCKIGMTADPDSRLYQLRRTSPDDLDYAWIGAPEGECGAIERDAHAMLDKYRRTGEWFAVTDDVAVGAIHAAAQRRHQHILGCSPELARQIIAAGNSQGRPRPSTAARVFGAVAQLALGAALSLAIIVFMIARLGRIIF